MNEIDFRTNEELLLNELSSCITVEKEVSEYIPAFNLDANEIVGLLEYYDVPADKVNDLWIHFSTRDVGEEFGRDKPVRGLFIPYASTDKNTLGKLIPGIDEESLNNKCFILIDVPNCLAHQVTLPAGHPSAIADTITHEVMHYIDYYKTKAEMAKKKVRVADRISFLSLPTTAAFLVSGILDRDHSELYTISSSASLALGALALSYSAIKGLRIDSAMRQFEPSVLRKTAHHMENGLVGSRAVL
ncbi:MAG TPA: hypothetical protein VJY84_00060 [Candidatus Saccharimonadales bacterium]|nr:hypothetical protein [Candidatus Saccharimonadales bacterium]